jgi:hypothetical protein
VSRRSRSRLRTRTDLRGSGVSAAGQEPPALDVHIGELIFHGFRRNDGDALGAALRAELARSLTHRNVPALFGKAGSHERVDAGQVSVPKHAPASQIGTHVARAIHAGLGGGAT